jgi:hypothetical protein
MEKGLIFCIPLYLNCSLYEMLYAPVPFIVGVHADYFQNNDMLDEVVFVDLDKNEVHLGDAEVRSLILCSSC